jgi:hypothetical protein
MDGVPTQTGGTSELLATDWNTYVRDNFDSIKFGHVVCTSSTRPTGIAEGTMVYETDTNKVLVYNGSAWVDTEEFRSVGVNNYNNLLVPPSVFLSRAASQSVGNNSEVVISWDTQISDNDDMWASGTDITVKTSGIYLISLYVNYQTASGAGLRENYINKNGVRQTSCTYIPTPTFSMNTSLTGILSCDVNDIISGSVYQNHGSPMNIIGHVEVCWLGRVS